MIYNTGWGNLKPQQLKYTPAIAAQAAKLLQLGQSLTATARALNISRASLRNWRDRDPALNRAFDTFEANKAKHEAKRQRVNHFKEVASDIVDAARQDAADPVKAGLEAQKQAKVKEAEKRPLSPEEAHRKRLLEDWASDWTPRLEAMKEQEEQEEMNREMELRRGFWTGCG